MTIADTLANASAALYEGATSSDVASGRLAVAQTRIALAEVRAQIQTERDALRLAERDATIAVLEGQVAELREFLAVVRP